MKRKIIERPPSARQKMINLMYIVLLDAAQLIAADTCFKERH